MSHHDPKSQKARRITHVEDAELLQDAGVGVVIVFGVVSLRKADGLEVDEGDEGETEDPVGHVADHVVEVGKHVQRSCASNQKEKKCWQRKRKVLALTR